MVKIKYLNRLNSDQIQSLGFDKMGYVIQCRVLMEANIFHYYFEPIGLIVFMLLLMLKLN